jgi:Carboxypeptidase regulatory-like domain
MRLTRLVTFLMLLVFGSLAWGDPTATILGRVTDPSGSSVAGAAVKVLNEATGIERSTVSTATGDFAVTLLPINGRYTLSVSSQGFEAYRISGIQLQVDQDARFDVALKIGSISQTVTAQAEAPVVNTDSGSIGQVIENRTILELPLNGRNFAQLATLTASAVTGPPNSLTGFTTIAVSGGHAAKTEFLLDGITNQEQLFDGIQFTPSVDAIQEFKVQANAFSAEYGRGNAVINGTIKSGTNQFHGDVYEFLRNSYLDAKNFFNTGPKAKLEQNQFGATLGGPIKRNKTFFFLNYEGTRTSQGNSSNTVVPTEAQRGGDFSGLLASGVQLTNPTTGQPLLNNQIPTALIDPATAFFLKFIPSANTAQGTFYYNAPFTSNADQGNVRVDHRFSEADSLFGRYSINNLDQYNPGSFPQVGGRGVSLRTQNAVLDETHIFSPTLINDLRLGYARMYRTDTPQGLGTNYTVQSGLGGFEETTANFPGFPTLNITGYGDIYGNDFSPLTNPTNTYEIIDSATWVRGAHSFRIGMDLRQARLFSTNAAHSRGNFSFDGGYTGDGFADFLTGYPSSGSRDFPRNLFGETISNYHFYVQDDYKISRRLTLNLGLRYEYNPQPAYFQNQSSWFDPLTGQIAVSLYHGAPNLTTQQVAKYAYPQFQSFFVTPKQAGVPNGLLFNQHDNWAPRIGVAFRPSEDNKTVIRAGAGIFYLLQSGNNTVSQPILNLPFIVDESISQSVVNGLPTTRAENFFQPFSSNSSFNTPYLATFDPHNRVPYLAEWNFAIQRELIPNMALEVAYVGSKGTHLEQTYPFNVPTINPNDTRPYQERLPFPAFSSGTFLSNANNSTYHSLQVTLEKRYSSGLSFLASYAWQKSLDGTTNDQGGDGADNPFNFHTMKGPSSLDIEHRFVFSYGYALPFGRGKAFGANMPRALDLIAGGWQLAGITTFQTGLAFTPQLGQSDPANVNYAYARRPDVIGSGSLSHRSIDRWFNINDFAVPQPFTIGNAGRNILRGPKLQNWDMSLLKNFNFSEQRYLQFRAEFFNIFNHPNFGLPNTNIEDSIHGGQITDAAAPRIIQFALKLYF